MTRPRRRRLPIVVGVLAAAALGGHSAPSTAAGTRTIAVKDNVFSPKKVTVSKDTRVTWRWAADAGEHNIRSRGTRKFKSSELKSDGVHRYRFTKAGTYKYVCTIHEDDGMTGQVIVR